MAYDRAHPGLAATLVKVMVDEAAARQSFRTQVLKAEVDDVKADRRERARGQHYALVIGFVAILVGAMTAVRGHDLPGGLIGGGGVIGLVAVFVQGRPSERRARPFGSSRLPPPPDGRA